MMNIEFVPFWPVFSPPCAMPPKSLPNAVCHISAVAGYEAFVAGDCFASYQMNHWGCVKGKVWPVIDELWED